MILSKILKRSAWKSYNFFSTKKDKDKFKNFLKFYLNNSNEQILEKKMFLAININLESIYKTYSINFRPPDDRKPSSQEIKRYSVFLKEHISIIDPKIIILLGGTAMEALIGLNSKITDERGKWKEIILKNKSYPLLITYNPSYLLRYPEYKRQSWEDLKNIREQIKKLKIQIK